MSPAWRWVKNSTGSAMTCQRKRLIMHHGELGLQPQQQRLAAAMVRMARNAAVMAHADQQRNEPVRSVPDQNIVDEDLGKSRDHNAGHDQREADARTSSPTGRL